jgi:DNA-binding NarL/FixJ family response regulator
VQVLRKASDWLRRHPRPADALLAAALLAFSAMQFSTGTAGLRDRAGYIAVTAVLAGTVISRRRYPTTAFAAAAVIGAAQIGLGIQLGAPGPVFALQPSNADLAILVLLYTLAARRPRRVSIAGLTVCLLGAAVAITRWSPAHQPYAGTSVLLAAAGLGGLTLTAWVLGDSVAYRYRRTRYAALEERAARLEVERDAQARIAAAAERERELTERRARVVDEAEARLRGIERNLHDGAQVRLAALAMTLGEIKENLQPGNGLRIVIAEDAAVMRDGLTQTLGRRGHTVVAAVADADELIRAVGSHRPDVAVIDVRMPPTHTDEGLRAAMTIRRDHSGVGTLVFSQYIEARAAAELLASSPAGVGYLLKDRVADVSDFIEALTSVARGGTVLDPEVVRQLFAVSRHADSLNSLTGREREVLALIAQGRSNAAIARTLFISPGVVEKHVASIFAKLGLAPSDSDNRRVIAAIRYLQGPR